MLHFFHNFKISCKGNKKHSNNQIKIERYDAQFNLMFIIYTCDVFNRLNAIPPHAEGTEKGACFLEKQIKKQPVTVLLSSFQTDRF